MKKYNKWVLNLVFGLAFILASVNVIDAKTFNPLRSDYPGRLDREPQQLRPTHPIFRAYPGIGYSLQPAIGRGLPVPIRPVQPAARNGDQ